MSVWQRVTRVTLLFVLIHLHLSRRAGLAHAPLVIYLSNELVNHFCNHTEMNNSIDQLLVLVKFSFFVRH